VKNKRIFKEETFSLLKFLFFCRNATNLESFGEHFQVEKVNVELGPRKVDKLLLQFFRNIPPILLSGLCAVTSDIK